MPTDSPAPSTPHDTAHEPRKVDWLLLNADWVATCDEDMRLIASGAVAIDGNRLEAVGPSHELRTRFRGRTEMDVRGHLLLPGLINAHTHGAMSCFRGLGDDLTLERWLQEVIFPAEAAHVSPQLVYWGTLLAAVEMLQNGVTTFCDGYFFELSAVAAARDAGIRAVLGQGVLDFPAPDLADPAQARVHAASFLDAFPTDVDRLRPSLFCHAPYTCGPDTLQWVKDMCRDHGILFQIHLSETASEVRALRVKHGVLPTFFLDRFELLDSMTLCAHGVWLDRSEIELLAERRTCVAHCVESNMKLASGIAPVPALVSAGVTVGLGTDGCASNNNLDILSEMDRVAKLHKVARRDPEVLPASTVLRMATRDAAAAIGWADAVGSLEPGKRADLVAIELNRPHLVPLYDPISHLVYAAKGSDVRHVWVDGRLVVADGETKTVSAADVCREVRSLSRSIKGNTA